jgi:hypothetical protein
MANDPCFEKNCTDAKQEASDHFVHLRRMIGDPRIDEIAFALSYFAVRIRKQEPLKQWLKEVILTLKICQQIFLIAPWKPLTAEDPKNVYQGKV